MKKTKVLLLSHSMTRTGAPQVIVNIANYLDSEQFEIVVGAINSSAPQDLAEKLKSHIQYEPFPLSSCSSNIFVRALRYCGFIPNIRKVFKTLLDKHHPDVVLINTVFHLRLGDILLEQNIPYIRYIHELNSYIETLSKEDQSRMQDRRMKLIACSEEVKELLQKLYKRQDIEVFPPSIEVRPDAIKPDRDISGPCRVITAGAVSLRKGFDLWVEVARRVLARNNNVVFEWFGDAADSEGLLKSCMQKIEPEYHHAIKFQGISKKLRQEMQNASLFFLSSREDPFPIVVLEALAEGLPVIGFNGGMLKELQLKAVAVAVPKFDVENLAQAIIDFAEGRLHFKDDCQEAAMQYSHQNILPKFSHLLNVNR